MKIRPVAQAIFLALALASPALTSQASQPLIINEASASLFRSGSTLVDEPLVIVVNKANAIDNVTSSELRNIFIGQRGNWPNGQKITVVMRDPTPERAAALQLIYRMSESDFSRYFLHASFSGQSLAPPKQLASSSGVRRFIFNVPGAVGYVRLSDLDDNVKAIRIDGLTARDSAYKFRIAGH
ncbi:MAG TPA: hypothetical protein VKM94_19775 [Blastocatellia bacterium]|nr:hypothetical protein [Blastocatellia bacterium]